MVCVSLTVDNGSRQKAFGEFREQPELEAENRVFDPQNPMPICMMCSGSGCGIGALPELAGNQNLRFCTAFKEHT
jgi:hypothetical protein